MAQEGFFRLLSIALLGLLGLLALPETQAQSNVSEAREEIQLQDELQAVLEVNEINSGLYKPHRIGDHSIDDPIAVSELDLMSSTRAAR